MEGCGLYKKRKREEVANPTEAPPAKRQRELQGYEWILDVLENEGRVATPRQMSKAFGSVESFLEDASRPYTEKKRKVAFCTRVCAVAAVMITIARSAPPPPPKVVKPAPKPAAAKPAPKVAKKTIVLGGGPAKPAVTVVKKAAAPAPSPTTPKGKTVVLGGTQFKPVQNDAPAEAPKRVVQLGGARQNSWGPPASTSVSPTPNEAAKGVIKLDAKPRTISLTGGGGGGGGGGSLTPAPATQPTETAAKSRTISLTGGKTAPRTISLSGVSPTPTAGKVAPQPAKTTAKGGDAVKAAVKAPVQLQGKRTISLSGGGGGGVGVGVGAPAAKLTSKGPIPASPQGGGEAGGVAAKPGTDALLLVCCHLRGFFFSSLSLYFLSIFFAKSFTLFPWEIKYTKDLALLAGFYLMIISR